MQPFIYADAVRREWGHLDGRDGSYGVGFRLGGYLGIRMCETSFAVLCVGVVDLRVCGV